MNRYLFNLILRKSPNFESWPLNDKNLNEIKKFSFNQSFIKIYKCVECNYCLKRIYAPELWSIPKDEVIECPKCGLEKLVQPKDYISTYKLIRKDLNKFSEKLRDIKVLNAKKYAVCTECNVELGEKSELGDLTNCQLCRGEIEYITRDEFTEKFLKLCRSEIGLWFEWFVYEIARNIYGNVEHGLVLTYSGDDGKIKEKEVDIVAIKDDKLILIECKNYLGHTPKNEYVKIVEISDIFDEIYVVNFFKPDPKVKRIISDHQNIQVLDGNQIDEVFLDNNLIISQLIESDSWSGIETFTRIPTDKKISIFDQIFKNHADRNMIRALIKLINVDSIDSNGLWSHYSEKLKKTLEFELALISNVKKSQENITLSLKLVHSYYYNFQKDQLSELFNPVKILVHVTGSYKIAESYNSQIKEIYNSIFNLYLIDDFNLTDISSDNLFDEIFDDLYFSYFENYYWRERISTLFLMEYIFEKINTEKICEFSNLIEREFKKLGFDSGTVADRMFKIFSKYEHKFGYSEKSKIFESAKYLKDNGINEYVISSADNFIGKLG